MQVIGFVRIFLLAAILVDTTHRSLSRHAHKHEIGLFAAFITERNRTLLEMTEEPPADDDEPVNINQPCASHTPLPEFGTDDAVNTTFLHLSEPQVAVAASSEAVAAHRFGFLSSLMTAPKSKTQIKRRLEMVVALAASAETRDLRLL